MSIVIKDELAVSHDGGRTWECMFGSGEPARSHGLADHPAASANAPGAPSGREEDDVQGMKIEASNRVVNEEGTVLVDSFWRHDCLVYMALREAGISHGRAAAQISKRYTGGGPRPRFFCVDEVELLTHDNDDEGSRT